jgi:hypothetical protein
MRAGPGIRLQHGGNLPFSLSQHPSHLLQHRQVHLQILHLHPVLKLERTLETAQIVGGVLQTRGGNRQVVFAERLIPCRIVGKREPDLSCPLRSRQTPLYLLLRRHYNDDIALDQGLAGQGITLLQRLLRQTGCGAPMYVTFLNDYGTAAATPLATTRDIQFNLGLLSRFSDKGSFRDLDLRTIRFENCSVYGLLPPSKLRGLCNSGLTHLYLTQQV